MRSKISKDQKVEDVIAGLTAKLDNKNKEASRDKRKIEKSPSKRVVFNV